MFKRKVPELKDIDLINKFNIVENKIDILNSKFESITYLDGCCNCKERDTKIYEMLIDYLETKFKKQEEIKTQTEVNVVSSNDFSKFKNEILSELKNICNICITDKNCNLNFDLKSMFGEIINIVSQIKTIDHQEYHIKHQNGINNISNFLSEHNQLFKTNDIKLRNDIQSFLIGLQNNIVNEFKNVILPIKTNDTLDVTVKLIQETVNDLSSNIKDINLKVNGFYFENELIKHQLLLEENINKYNDELDSLKIKIKNTTDGIDKILEEFNYNTIQTVVDNSKISRR